MSIYALKTGFQNLLRPLVRVLYARGITANQVTLFACMVSIFIGVLLIFISGSPIWFCLLPLWLFIRMALNAADGMLAREFGQQSKLGGYLNEITDVVADAALYMSFAFITPFNGLQIGGVIWLAAMSEFCGVLGQIHGNGRRYDGPMGKSDRAFVFGSLGLWYALAKSLPQGMGWGMWLLLVLLVYTCVRRICNGLRHIA